MREADAVNDAAWQAYERNERFEILTAVLTKISEEELHLCYPTQTVADASPSFTRWSN